MWIRQQDYGETDICLLESLPLGSLLNCPYPGEENGRGFAYRCPALFQQAVSVSCTENVELLLKRSRSQGCWLLAVLKRISVSSSGGYTHLKEIRVLKITPAS